MQTKRFFSRHRGVGLALCAAALLGGTACAQNSGSITRAFQVARQAVRPAIQTKVVSLYGLGTPDSIQKWYIIFYDSTVPSHGRAVLVENSQITRTYAARGGVTYSSRLTFDPSRITSETLALNAAQAYAARRHIAYDGVRVLLKQTSLNKPFCWRVELLSGKTSFGFVYVKALDDTVATYEPASTDQNSSTTTSDSNNKGFANDVKNTFLHIGGDLEEFFTGERTVDK